MRKYILILVLTVIFVGAGCEEENVNGVEPTPQPTAQPTISRESKIPSDTVKVTPEMDIYPPQLHSDEWDEPIPVPGLVNTAGAEDSPFIMPDGNTLYFFFTPDVDIPVEKQLLDGVTGIYVSEKVNGVWLEPERVMLHDPGKLSLDGCTFVQGNMMWFCTAREGYTGLHWFTADYVSGSWTNWQNADFDPAYEVGELHFSSDSKEVYFHSPREGGQGGYDIWISRNVDSEWQEPENISAVNSADTEGWPYLSQDGNELWFLRTYMGSPALYRSMKAGGEWQEPELIISQFAGEPSLDNHGNIYFVHHFYRDGVMLEADIYVAYRK